MSDPTKYNSLGRMMTGFDSGSDKSFYGHWSNPEYQQNEQLETMNDQQYQEYLSKQYEESVSPPHDSNDYLPF